jgi:hypothetical protein
MFDVGSRTKQQYSYQGVALATPLCREKIGASAPVVAFEILAM